MNVSDIQTELSDHGFGNTVNSTRQIWFINDAIWDICSREKWPFLEKTATLSFNGSSATPSSGFPTDFKAAVDVVNTTTGAVIMPERVEFLDKRNANIMTQAGDPVWYWFQGSGTTATINFWPIPPSAQTLQMRYICQHPQVTSGTTETGILIPSQHHRVISLGALWKCYDMEDDTGMAMRYQQLYETRIESMKRDVFMRQYDRPDRVYVIGYDDYDQDFYY